MNTKRYQVVRGQRDRLYLEGRKALFQFFMTGDEQYLAKVSEIGKRLDRRADLYVVTEAPSSVADGDDR